MEDLSNYFTSSSVLNGFCDNSLTTFRWKMVLKDKNMTSFDSRAPVIWLDLAHQNWTGSTSCWKGVNSAILPLITLRGCQRSEAISLPGAGRMWLMQSDFSYQRTNGIAFGRNHSLRYNGILYTRNIESFILCPVYNGTCITMSSRILDLGSNGGSLGGTELMSNLLLIDLIREGALTWASVLKSLFVVSSAIIFFSISQPQRVCLSSSNL